MADIKFNKRNIFQRFLGIPVTLKPGNPKCWNYAGGKLTIDLNQAPELKQAGGALRFEGGGLPARVLVIREDDDGFRALQNRCTHMGHRRLDPVPGTNTIQCCSVGKSTYDPEGKNVFGPAPGPIVTYRTELDGDRLIVALS